MRAMLSSATRHSFLVAETAPRCCEMTCRPAEAVGELWEIGHGVLTQCAGVAGDVDDTNAFGSDGRDVELAAGTPVDLDVLAPGADVVVATEAIAQALAVGAVEPSPAADGGGVAIGSDQPAEVDGLAVDCGRVAAQKLDVAFARSASLRLLLRRAAAAYRAGADERRPMPLPTGKDAATLSLRLRKENATGRGDHRLE